MAPKRKSANTPTLVHTNWTEEECKQLVSYVKKNGYDGNIETIEKLFPGHTNSNVRSFMHTLYTNTNDQNSEHGKLALKFEALQEQARINALSQSYGSAIPIFCDWRAIFEDHPDPSECDGVNYAEIYHAIASLMRGEVPRELNQPTAKKFLEVINKFLSDVTSEQLRVDYPQTFKKPVSSMEKNQQLCNATLAKRRSKVWSPGEIKKAEMLLNGDLNTVREIYLTPSWANPFRFPDEPSPMRKLKLAKRKEAGVMETPPAKKKRAVRRKRT